MSCQFSLCCYLLNGNYWCGKWPKKIKKKKICHIDGHMYHHVILKKEKKPKLNLFFCLSGSIFWPSKHNSKPDYCLQNNFLFWLFAILAISIQEITVMTKLTWHWKVRDQIDTIERLRTKLKYSVKNRNQIHSLSK